MHPKGQTQAGKGSLEAAISCSSTYSGNASRKLEVGVPENLGQLSQATDWSYRTCSVLHSFSTFPLMMIHHTGERGGGGECPSHVSENLSFTYQDKKVEKINKLFLLEKNRAVQAGKDWWCFIFIYLFIYYLCIITFIIMFREGDVMCFKETCWQNFQTIHSNRVLDSRTRFKHISAKCIVHLVS